MEPTRALVLGDDEFEFHRFGMLAPLFERIFDGIDWLDATVTTDRERLDPAAIHAFDVVVDYMTTSELTDAQLDGLTGFVSDGNGYVPLHAAAAMYTESNATRATLEALIGGAFEEHPSLTELRVTVEQSDHPITSGVEDFTVVDEPYVLRWDPSVTVLATTEHEEFPGDGRMPVAWCHTYGDGRVFYYAHGHDDRSLRDPAFRQLLERGIAWTVDRPVP